MAMLTATRLTPVHPVANALVEGGAAEFYWQGPPKATYLFQITTDAEGHDVVFEATVARTTLLTVFEALPERGDRYFWRVRLDNEPEGWTESTPFIATHQDQIVRANLEVTKQERRAALGADAPPSASADAPTGPASPAVAYDPSEGTSTALAISLVALMFGSFVTLLTVLIAVMR